MTRAVWLTLGVAACLGVAYAGGRAGCNSIGLFDDGGGGGFFFSLVASVGAAALAYQAVRTLRARRRYATAGGLAAGAVAIAVMVAGAVSAGCTIGG